MLKYILLILFVCTQALADTIPGSKELTIPHQSKELIEIYTRLEPILYEDLQLEHTYKVFDDIFILPDEFYGEAELYNLKFYIDQDIKIENRYDANCYRILYENRASVTRYEVIPEPTTIALILPITCLVLKRRKK